MALNRTVGNYADKRGARNYQAREAKAVINALDALDDELAELKRQFKEWIEWPFDVELDDPLMVSLLRCHKLLSDVAFGMAVRDRG